MRFESAITKNVSALNQLQNGVRVYESSSCQTSSRPRIWLSSGTEIISAIASERISKYSSKYCDGAFIPREPWREPTLSELEILQIDIPPALETGIGIIQLPDEILEPFAIAETFRIKTQAELKTLNLQQRCQEALAGLMDYFVPFSLSGEKPAISGFWGKPPGLPTSTTDNQRGCHNGLHTDSWDKLPVAEKHLATNRICVNLGCEDRFFLFVNLTESQLLELIGGNPEQLQYTWTRNMTTAFLTQYPNYPVVKLRVSSGEAYIAPTENIIHDATTIGKEYIDLKVMLRGHYLIPV